MAYTYRNKKTGEVINLNHHAKSAYWEEVDPEQEETFDEENFEEETFEEETFEEEAFEEKVTNKTGRKRGKKE